MVTATSLEKENLEAHVDLCTQRYRQLERRLDAIESKVEHIHNDVVHGNKSMIRVIVTACGTVVAGLLSTIVVILITQL